MKERERRDTLKPPLNKPISSPLLLVSVVVLCDGVTRLPSRLHERVIERGLQHVLACVCTPCVYTVCVCVRAWSVYVSVGGWMCTVFAYLHVYVYVYMYVYMCGSMCVV